MEIKGESPAPCGLYCGVCAIMMAHRDNNQKLKGRLAPLYGVSPEGIRCQGCLSSEVFAYCTTCPIKACTSQGGYEGWHQCDEFPCHHIESFPALTSTTCRPCMLQRFERILNRSPSLMRGLFLEQYPCAGFK